MLYKKPKDPDNKTTLDKISESGGVLLFNSIPVAPSGVGGSTGIASGSYLSGKKVYCFGDSITQGPTPTTSYPYYLGQQLNATTTNFGSSGADTNRFRCIICGGTSSGGLTFVAPDYTGVDICTLTIGHNQDVGTSSLNDISGISDFNLYPDTFYGNICRSIEYILSQNPNIKIYLMTPIQSTNATYMPRTANATTAIKNIGNYYALPVIDLHNISGLNPKNLSLWTSDGTTHPTADGHQKFMAPRIARQMQSY